MTAPTEHLRSLLTTHVATSGWQLETGAMPPKPDKIIMLTDTVGVAPNPRYLLDFPTAQIMVRGEVGEYLAARDECQAVKDLLLGLASQDIGGDRMVSITQNGDLGSIGRDENDRPLFVLNIAMIIEPATTSETNRVVL